MTLAQRAVEARTALFTRYDQLNALFEEAEQEFTRHHLPRGVEFAYREHFDEQGQGTVFALGIQKVKGKWRLCHTSYYFPHGYYEGDYEWVPLVEASAENRVRAAEHVVKLREMIVETLEKFVPETDEAITKLRSSVQELKNEDLVKLLAERAKLNGKAK